MHSLSAKENETVQRVNLHRFILTLVLQRLKAQAVRTRGFFAQALTLVGFVLVVVAVKEHHLAVAFKGKNVRGDTVKEPAVMRGHHRAARKFKKRFFKGTQRFNVKVVGRFVKEENVSAL